MKLLSEAKEAVVRFLGSAPALELGAVILLVIVISTIFLWINGND